MKLFRYILIVILLSIFSVSGIFAQPMNLQKEDPSSFMIGNGKVFVVVAVIVVIVAGLLLYLITLDRKISKLEKAERKDS